MKALFKKTSGSAGADCWLLALLLAAFFLFQLPRLDQAPWENYDSWRQTDTYTIAQNYAQRDMNPLRPQFNYDGPGDNYVQLELQVMPYLSAVLFKILGREPYWVPRLISLLFFMGSAVFCYGIGRRLLKNRWAALGAFAVYLVMPISLLYSRAIMPEAAALFFYTVAIYFFLRWYQGGGRGALALSGVMMGLAIMEKTPTAFAGLMIVVLFFKKRGLRSFKDPMFYGYGALSLGLPLLYYWYAGQVATFTFVSGIAEKHILKSAFTAIFTSQAWEFFQREMPLFFSWPVLIGMLLGVLCCLKRKNLPLLLWTLSMALETAAIVAVIRFGYYMVFLAPLFALLCAAVLLEVGKWIPKAGAVLGCVLCAAVFSHSLIVAWPMASVNETITAQAQVIQKVTDEEDVLAVASPDPVLLGACRRMGYRANLRYYDYIPEEPEEELAYFLGHGVRYFVVPGGVIPGEDGEEYLELLQTRYPLVYQGEECLIFDLEGKV